MSKELSLEQKVVITRSGATFYVDKERAERLSGILQSANKPEYIKLDETLLAVREITMIAPTSKVEELNKRRQGQWLCAHGHWHSREESICKQNWGKQQRVVTKEKKLSRDAKLRGKRVSQLIEDGHSLADALRIVNKIDTAKKSKDSQ